MNNNPIQHITSCRLPTEFGVFQMHGFVDTRTPNKFATPQEHVALVLGDVGNGEPVLSRIHSECLTGDAFLSQKCDCGIEISERVPLKVGKNPENAGYLSTKADKLNHLL